VKHTGPNHELYGPKRHNAPGCPRCKLNAAAPDLLEACKHGAMSIHHPACSHGKRGDGNTCECHVKKCQDAIEKATT